MVENFHIARICGFRLWKEEYERKEATKIELADIINVETCIEMIVLLRIDALQMHFAFQGPV